MSDIREKYGLIVQNVKAAFFDEVYREQGLISVLTGKIEQFNEEKKNLLNQLFLKQNGDIEKVLGLLEDLEISIEELIKTGESIKDVYNDVSSSSEEKQINSNDAVGKITVNVESEKAVSEEPVVEATKVENAIQNDSTSTEGVKSQETVSADMPIVIPNVEVTSQSDNTSTESVKSEETAPADTSVVIPNAEVTSQNDNTSTESVKSEEIAPADTPVVIPNAEVTSQSDNTSTESVKSEETAPADTSVVIPNVEGAFQSDNTSVESVAEGSSSLIPIVDENTDNSLNVNEENNISSSDAMKFIRNSIALTKAILVTKVQYDKLVASLEKQKFILEKNGLASDADIKKKMEDLLNQANVLYQEGKTTEAQDLYNQVSEMNKTLQGSVGA